jgi:GT2 family glycosyltransferase
MTQKVNEGGPRLSVIIVSYKCRALLTQCLDSLYNDPMSGDLEIIVVDNASADGTVDEVRSRYPHVAVIDNGENVGFPAANNQALRVARADSLLLINPDTVVTPHAISTLVEFLEREPIAKVVGLNVRNPDGSPQDTVHRSLPAAARFVAEQIGLPKLLVRPDGDDRPVDDERREPQVVGWVSGAALAFSRQVVERIGLLDEAMFWAEDLDFCYRAGAAGIPVYFLPTAHVLHYVGQSGKKNYRRMLYAQHASRVVFAERHYGRFASVMLRTMMAVVLPAKMTLRLAQLSRRSRRAESIDRLAGYWDALKFCLTSSSVQSVNRS